MPTTYAIIQGNKYMDATTYSGAGGNSTVTNVSGFKPDLVWIKSRTDGGSHSIQDSVRGVGSATKLSSNSTNAENNASADATDPIYGYVTAINSNGFSVYAGTTPSQVNKSGQNYVGWQWQAAQGSNVTNTSGTITSTVSANLTAGFSIVTYTGNGSVSATVGHGLGVTPAMVITKGRSAVTPWMVKHTSLASNNNLLLMATDAQTNVTTGFNDGGIANLSSSSTFGFLNGAGANCNNSNKSATTYVAYCWAPVAGFSQFGSYTGNNSTDGPFIYTGFKPKFVIIKRTDTTANWVDVTSSISTYNVVGNYLYPNLSSAETTGAVILDLLSNGFKLRCDPAVYTAFNANGGTYIYMAWAETPFKYANAR